LDETLHFNPFSTHMKSLTGLKDFFQTDSWDNDYNVTNR